jgi:hypothetical protein
MPKKGEAFTQYLATVFQPHNVNTRITLTRSYQDEQDFKAVITLLEVGKEIDRLGSREAAENDEK